MIKRFEKAQVIFLEADKNQCAMGFYYEYLNILKNKKVLFITSGDFSIIKNDITMIKPNFKDFDTIHKNIEFLFIKDNFLEMIESFSVENFNTEFLEFSKKEYEVVILHRIDLLELLSSKILEKFIKNIKYNDKQVIISFDKDYNTTVKEDLYIKLNYLNQQCNIEYKNRKDLKIALITSDTELITIHKKLFHDVKNITLNIFSNKKIKKHKIDYDYIIYHDEGHFDLNVTKKLRLLSDDAKIVYISDRTFLRDYDYEEFKKVGVEEVLVKNFDIKRYVSKFEKDIGQNFYTDKVKKFSLSINNNLSHEQFLKYIDYLNKNNIIYNSIGIERERVKKDIRLSDFRKGDLFHYDKVHDMMVFVFLDTFKNGAKKLLQERLNLPKENLKEFAR